MPSLAFGLVHDLLGSYPRRTGNPADVDVEFEPEETIEVLEPAIRRLGHQPLRIGNPHALLAQLGSGELPALDVALTRVDGTHGRNREAWAALPLQMAGVPSLGSDALTLSATLDPAWACRLPAAARVPLVPQRCFTSSAEAETLSLASAFPLFVKPRWEGTAKRSGPTARVEDLPALRRQLERIRSVYDPSAVAAAPPQAPPISTPGVAGITPP